MQGYNHVAGGLTFTAIFCSFSDLNIYERADYIAVTVFFALLPDVDYSRSMIGRAFYPISNYIMRRWGHRTITHSIFFYIAALLVVSVIDAFLKSSYTLICAFALGSHLIFDMCTKQGVQLFYPFSRRPAVLPGDANLRLSVNDHKSEVIVFLVFCSLNFFSIDLYANGFWTKYNKKFMTFEHLDREIKRKKGVYNIKYMTIESQDTLSAIVYSIEGDKVTILDRKGFSFINASNCQLVDFQKDSRNKIKKVLNLFSISVDSLNSILRDNIIVSLSIQADEELYYFENVVMKKGTSFDMNFPKRDIVFFEGLKAQDNSDIEMKLLSIQEEEIERRYAYDMEVHNKKVQRYEELRQRHDTNAIAEGIRRRKEQEMKEELEEYIKPYKENTESYNLRRELLRRNMKKKKASLSASLVLWN